MCVLGKNFGRLDSAFFWKWYLCRRKLQVSLQVVVIRTKLSFFDGLFYLSYFLVMQTSPGMQRLCRRHQSMMIVPVTAAKRQIPIRCNGQITSTVAVTHIAVSHFNTNELQLSVVLLPPAVTQFSMTGGNFRKFQAC